jgi:membrane-associated phospholipid phosphatase
MAYKIAADKYLLGRGKIGFSAGLLALGVLFCVFLFCFDRNAVLWAKSLHNSGSSLHVMLERIDPVINFISHGMTLLMLSIILFVAGKILNSSLCGLGKLLIKGFIFSGVTAQILKYVAGRARPRLSFETLFYGPSTGDSYHSFPSGHTTVAFCFAYILAGHFPRYRNYFYLLASIMAFERVEDLKHFPSDVCAGAIIGVVIARILTYKKENEASRSRGFSAANADISH